MATVALRIYALSTFAVSAQAVLGRGFFAMKDTKTPLTLTKRMILFSFLLYGIVTLVFGQVRVGGWYLGFNLRPGWVYIGLATATTAVLTLNMCLFLTRLQETIGGLNVRGMLRATLKITLAALLAMGVASLALFPLHGLVTQGRGWALLALVLAGGAGVCGYLATCVLFHVSELRTIKQFFKGKNSNAT
jgi:peptidoglycan biosynthesis protein MviN/MurJ (putative lipid II flippase)